MWPFGVEDQPAKKEQAAARSNGQETRKACAGGCLQRNYFFALATAHTAEVVRPTTNPDAERQAYGQYNLCDFPVDNRTGKTQNDFEKLEIFLI